MKWESLPDEWLELHFVLKDGESFKVDVENVEVEKADPESQHRAEKIKKWILSTDSYDREISEDEVKSVMVVMKEEYYDEAKGLPEES